MREDELRTVLEAMAAGQLGVEGALAQLSALDSAFLGFAQVDHHRAQRQGFAEVIFGEGKTAEQLAAIATELLRRGANVLATRVDPAKAAAVQAQVPSLTYHPVARCLVARPHVQVRWQGAPVLLVCAGTSDLPVIAEAAVTLEVAGVAFEQLTDVGVAGLHRLLRHEERLRAAPAMIVAAGMEGALPSVVGGLVSCPVVAVPTSVGYGAALQGFTALFGMLTSCASGVTVVNIDNGFGAAMAVLRIVQGRGAGDGGGY